MDPNSSLYANTKGWVSFALHIGWFHIQKCITENSLTSEMKMVQKIGVVDYGHHRVEGRDKERVSG